VVTKDVALAVKVLSKYKCTFAVRGGGHTPHKDSGANTDNGVTIDLRSMKTVTVSADKSTVAVKGGARWIDVYSLLDTLGLAVSGGRVSPVGVGGLVTGGGISFFTARYGFVCDNVKEYEVNTTAV
jgi:FAD/FMN-containing dehydrogenase